MGSGGIFHPIYRGQSVVEGWGGEEYSLEFQQNIAIFNTFLQSSYHSNEKESRPKTKFFSLMIYAGYPA